MRASHLMVEESLQIVDAEALTSVDVSRAASRAKSRQWIAGKYNRAAYGESREPTVSISIGSLHLDALRARQMTPAIGQASTPPALKPSSDTLAEDVQVVD